jgi:hypothetical protein
MAFIPFTIPLHSKRYGKFEDMNGIRQKDGFFGSLLSNYLILKWFHHNGPHYIVLSVVIRSKEKKVQTGTS